MCFRRMPFIIKLLLWILIPVILIAGGLYAGTIYVEKTYGIDIFQTIRDVRALSQKVDESVICPNSFSDEDLKELKETTDSALPGLITVDESGNYNVTPENVNSFMTGEIKFTDRQIASIVNKNLLQVLPEDAESSGQVIPEVKQILFSNIENGNADFNVVTKVSLTSFKAKMNSFPYNLISGIIPDNLYISATVNVVKSANPFEYSIVSKGLKINNFDEKRTKNFLDVLKKVDPTFDSEQLNLTIATPFVDGMIGKEGKPGLCYGLKNAGAKDYKFITENNRNYFVVEKGGIVLP